MYRLYLLNIPIVESLENTEKFRKENKNCIMPQYRGTDKC